MLVGRVPIEDFGVEGAAQPAQHRLVFVMARVAQDFEQVRVAAHASQSSGGQARASSRHSAPGATAGSAGRIFSTVTK
jgi:hypothetical protein